MTPLMPLTHYHETDELLDCGSIWQVCKWTREYSKCQGQGPLLRFNIGVYQRLGLSSLDEHLRAEAAGATTVHLLGAAFMFLTGPDSPDDALPEQWAQIDASCHLPNAVTELRAVELLTQQYCYLTTCKLDSIRWKRMNVAVVINETAVLVSRAMACVRPSMRATGVEHAIRMLVEAEWKR